MNGQKHSLQYFNVMAKPSGSACNLDCDYCFYLEKKSLFAPKSKLRMRHETLAAYIQNTILSTAPEMPVLFAWQGGEPTLLGIDFFQEALLLQQKYGKGRIIENTLQTNGVLIDENWARFLAQNHFLVGLSLDGPAHIHDYYRRDKQQKPTQQKVLNALFLLQKHLVEVNILASVSSYAAQYPLEIYQFFKDCRVQFIQFIPIVERVPSASAKKAGLSLDIPPKLAPKFAPESSNENREVTDWSVLSKDFGAFLNAIFDVWRKEDVGFMYVMNFEWTLAAIMHREAAICVHQENCGRALITEHNGDVYSCDHYVYPQYLLGNLKTDSLAMLVDSAKQQAFGTQKSSTLPKECQECAYLKSCFGGCPKHRFIKSADNEEGLNYLCAGYKAYFRHTKAPLQAIADLLNNGHAAAEIMASGNDLTEKSFL